MQLFSNELEHAAVISDRFYYATHQIYNLILSPNVAVKQLLYGVIILNCLVTNNAASDMIKLKVKKIYILDKQIETCYAATNQESMMCHANYVRKRKARTLSLNEGQRKFRCNHAEESNVECRARCINKEKGSC